MDNQPACGFPPPAAVICYGSELGCTGHPLAVYCDAVHDYAVYGEPNVWVRHRL